MFTVRIFIDSKFGELILVLCYNTKYTRSDDAKNTLFYMDISTDWFLE